MFQGPLIQVVGVALITEFYGHNNSFVEVVFQSDYYELRKSDI